MKMIKFELAILLVLFGTSSFGMVTSTPLNYTYRFDVYSLENCPKNAQEFETAAKRKNCTGNSRYLCAPDKYLSNLIEFCTDRPVSLFENGHCVRLEGTGDLNHYRCEDKFQRGCPTEPYTDEEIYKYPACLEINIGFHCFAADKDCPERIDKYVPDNFKKEESINTTHTEKSDGSIKSRGAIVICAVYAIMMTTVTGIMALFVIKQRNKKNRSKTEILLLEGMPDETISIKTDSLQTESSKGESGTDTCEREEKGIKTVVKMDKDKEITIRHIRGIIVGCGGAGKTTLLERLKGTSYQDLQKIESTVIADVHPNCFEVLEEDQNIKYVGSDRTKPAILLHEGMLHEKRSIKTDLLETENTRKDESGTDSRERKELTGRMPNIETKKYPDQRRENDHHDTEKTPLLPDLEKILPEERAHLLMQTKNEKIRNEIETNKDENYSETLNAITEELNNELSGRKHLSTQVTFLDFAGQSMYYAFHQIFLSPKTFYILVVDMTKEFDEVEKHSVRKGKSPGKQEKLCSRFQSWKYKDYYKFWLESINRFSDKNTQVIIVGTHAEKLSETACDEFFDDLYALFANHRHLKKHLHTERRYAIGIPEGVLKLDEVKEIKECIAKIAQCPIYSEHSIRFSWAVFERFLQQEKIKKNKKIISRKDLLHHNSQFKEYKVEDDEISKLLEYLYMAGSLLYFNEEKLKDTIILDLEWFVDAFKCIIKYEVPKQKADPGRDKFQKTGELLDEELVKIWKGASNDCFLHYKEDILNYMERLELLAIYESHCEKSRWYYVPSMNKKKFDMKTEGFSKSSIFCFDFSEQEHNPIFLFYRLSLKCSKLPKWTFQKDDNNKCIYENVVCLYYLDHTVVICVCKFQIQVQVCRKTTKVDRTLLPEIQKSMEQIMGTYHKYCYRVGYKCQDGKLNDEADTSFVDIDSFSEVHYCKSCTNESVHSIDKTICWVQIKDRQNEEAPLQQPESPKQGPSLPETLPPTQEASMTVQLPRNSGPSLPQTLPPTEDGSMSEQLPGISDTQFSLHQPPPPPPSYSDPLFIWPQQPPPRYSAVDETTIPLSKKGKPKEVSEEISETDSDFCDERPDSELLLDFLSNELQKNQFSNFLAHLRNLRIHGTESASVNNPENCFKVLHGWYCKNHEMNHMTELKKALHDAQMSNLVDKMENFSKAKILFNPNKIKQPKTEATPADIAFLANNVGGQYRRVLRFLDIKQNEIEQAEAENEKVFDRVYQSLVTKLPKLTRQTVCNAFHYVHLNNKIDDLNSKWSP